MSDTKGDLEICVRLSVRAGSSSGKDHFDEKASHSKGETVTGTILRSGERSARTKYGILTFSGVTDAFFEGPKCTSD